MTVDGSIHESELLLKRRNFGCDRWPLHYAVRTGNIEDVQYLVEIEKKSVNEQDFHDATPLYLAALTGNTQICQYLLEHGAKCDPESGGDAARVFYVALTPELRKMLKDWNLSAASRDAFLDIIRKSFNDSTYADCFVTLSSPIQQEDDGFEASDKTIVYLHYAMLYSRCPTLASLLTEKNSNGKLTELKFPIKYRECDSAVYDFCQYLYTGKFETRDMEKALVVHDMAKHFLLDVLHEKLNCVLQTRNDIWNESSRFKFQYIGTDMVKSDLKEFVNQVSIPLEDPDFTLSTDILQWSDSTIRCNDRTWSVHNFLICSQSEYFGCALSGGFREAEEAFIELSHLVPSPDAVKLAIQWMYCDSFLDTFSLEASVILLELGSAILCPRLSIHTANTVLIPAVNTDNVFGMLDLALAYNLTRLEDKCVDIFAMELDALAPTQDFKNVIAREVAGTKQSGDVFVTDVPIAAEIRSSILRNISGDNARSEQIRRLRLLRSVVQLSIEANDK